MTDWPAGTPDVTLSLPLPPSANRMWRIMRGHPVKAAPYIAWIGQVTLAARLGQACHIPNRYALRMVMPEQRKDPDNLIKPTNDALAKAGVIANDKHMRRFDLEVNEAHPDGLMTVELWVLPDGVKKIRTRATTPLNGAKA